jgi:hypothetical protein
MAVQVPVTTPSLRLACERDELTVQLDVDFLGGTINSWDVPEFGQPPYIAVGGRILDSRERQRWFGAVDLSQPSSVQFHYAASSCRSGPACYNCDLTTDVQCQPMNRDDFTAAIQGQMLPAPTLAVKAAQCGELLLALQWEGTADFVTNPSQRYGMHVYDGELSLWLLTVEEVEFDLNGSTVVRLTQLQAGTLYSLRVVLFNPITARPSFVSTMASATRVDSCTTSSIVGQYRW